MIVYNFQLSLKDVLKKKKIFEFSSIYAYIPEMVSDTIIDI